VQRFPTPVLVAAVLLAASAALAAAPVDLPEPGARDEAAASAALARFGTAFKARKYLEAENAGRDAWVAGAGAEALEALAVTALQEGRVPRAHQFYVAILSTFGAPEDVQRRAANQIAAMERQSGDLAIKGGAAGTAVSIDGDPVTTLPLVVAPRAMPGRRVVAVGDYSTTVRFAAGRTTQVVVPSETGAAALVPVPVPVALPVPLPAALPGGGSGPALPISGGEALAGARETAEAAVADGKAALEAAAREAAAARPEVQAVLAARERALEARDRARKARAALSKLQPERLRTMIARDPELKQALAALTDDQAVLQQVALAMQSGGGVEGVGRQLAADARVQRVLDRLKTLLMTETGIEEVFE
jgi:hypothetical protein